VGNKDEIIERIYERSYLPFLKILDAHPKISVNLHYTGFLLDWFEKNHSEFIDLLRKVVERRQVELIGGAYFEPIIAVIPNGDARGQTRLLSEKITSIFGVKPAGFWTAERAWEPQLPEILSEVGGGHTFVDDISFESAGLVESDCFEPYAVESRGSFVSVFPILKKLRYCIPFQPVSKTISYLRAARGASIAVYADDGEKFGAWPSTYEQVYERGWLESFFAKIESQSWIETVKVSEYLKSHPANKRIYLPASTYSEMMEWAIPLNGSEIQRIKRGAPIKKIEASIPHRGFWRLFLAKYPESARMYSKMLAISKNLHTLGDSAETDPIIDLWKGQCNDAYWHGVFGGLYATILRRITYQNLIRAQVSYERKTFGSKEDWLSISENSFSQTREINLDSKNFGAVVVPSAGGSICELDFKPLHLNMVDTLARRPERYHGEVRKKSNRTIVPGRKKNQSESIHESSRSKEKGLKELLVYDRYPKFAFVDYLVSPDSEIDSFAKQDFVEVGPLPSCRYEVQIQKSNQSAKAIQTSGIRTGKGIDIRITKEVTVFAREPKLKVEYSIESHGKELDALFVPEINLGSLFDQTFLENYKENKILSSENFDITYGDLGARTRISSPGAKRIWAIPVRTVSLSEEGFESNLQGISVLPSYELQLSSGEHSFKTVIELDVQKTE